MDSIELRRARFVNAMAELCVRLDLAGIMAMGVEHDGAIHRCQCSPTQEVKAELDELAAVQRQWLEARGTFAGNPLGTHVHGGTAEMHVPINHCEN